MTQYLDFEKPLAEIEGKAEELRAIAEKSEEEMDVAEEAAAPTPEPAGEPTVDEPAVAAEPVAASPAPAAEPIASKRSLIGLGIALLICFGASSVGNAFQALVRPKAWQFSLQRVECRQYLKIRRPIRVAAQVGFV